LWGVTPAAFPSAPPGTSGPRHSYKKLIRVFTGFGEPMIDLLNITRSGLADYCRGLSFSAVHADNLFRQTYKRMLPQPWQGGTLPAVLVRSMQENFEIRLPDIRLERTSGYDRSVKFLLELAGGGQVESVLMPEKKRLTLCISSQVGCAQGCVFCHTGRMGLTRNLSAGEIVGQVYLANAWISAHSEWLADNRLPADARVSNIVFMGMGEPLDNVDGVGDAIEILTDPYGFALGLAHISVSTAGHLDGIEAIFQRIPGVRLALSVHSADEAKRSKIMPINRRWPLSKVIARLKELQASAGARAVLLQYTMIRGVNDSPVDAQMLADLTTGLDAKINLIPLNEVSASRLTAPDAGVIQTFRDILHARGIRVMVRYSKGQDIAAACGQLVVNS
jgi:23S rRNA (adenine2503-C2)-methyltransferase